MTLAPDRPPLVALDRVSRAFDGGRIVALREVTLQVARHDLVALHGPSGSGKSTLLALMSGLDLPTSGTVAFDGAATPGPAAWTKLRPRASASSSRTSACCRR